MVKIAQRMSLRAYVTARPWVVVIALDIDDAVIIGTNDDTAGGATATTDGANLPVHALRVPEPAVSW
jgi:hypothetical protein